MALARRVRGDVDWPGWSDWFPRRRLPGWLDPAELFGEGLEEEPLRVEQYEEGSELVVKAEMPGMDPERDVEITVSDHRLRIRAERRQESRTEDASGYRSEFQYGSFVRTLPLPAEATEDDVKASYRDGILEVRVPIDREKGQARKVAISRG